MCLLLCGFLGSLKCWRAVRARTPTKHFKEPTTTRTRYNSSCCCGFLRLLPLNSHLNSTIVTTFLHRSHPIDTYLCVVFSIIKYEILYLIQLICLFLSATNPNSTSAHRFKLSTHFSSTLTYSHRCYRYI